MNDQDIVPIVLKWKENIAFECKRADVKPSKLLKTIVAFANTEGGVLVVGLEDPLKARAEKRLIGISENLDNVSEFLKLIEREIDPPLQSWQEKHLPITNTQKDDDQLLVVYVEKSNDVHSLKQGDTLVRRGNQIAKIGSKQIIRLQYEKGSIKFEDELSGIRNLEELDGKLLGKYKKDTRSESQDNWQFLKDNGLAVKQNDGFELTKAGVLLFGNNPSVILGNKCGIKISHYYGTKPTYSGEPNFVRQPFTVEGPLLIQIQKTLDYFMDVVKSSPPKLRGHAFRPSLLIPEWVFQEAVANTVIHRNYFLQDDIQIRFFDDHIEIESPGIYPGHITVRNIRSERFARNPLIQRTLSRFRESPNLDIGEGVDRMFEIMKEHNLYDPIYSPSTVKHSVLLYLFNVQRTEYWDTVSKYLDEHHRITNSEARNITGIKDTLKMTRLLKSWVDRGLLEKIGERAKRIVYYTKPGQDIQSSLFSMGVENK